MNLDVVEADQRGAHLLRHHKTVTLSSLCKIRAADRIVELHFLPDAGVVFLTHLDVGAEAAGGNHHCTRINRNLAAEILGHDARDALVGGDEIRHLGIGQDLNASARILNDVFKRADVGIARRRRRIVASLPEGARCGADLILKFDAQAFEPVDLVH